MSQSTTRPYQVAVYYFPNYHVDPRNVAQHGADWTEWNLVHAATPRYEGHQQPKVPLWGYVDESDPAVFAQKIAAAADHGVDAFIFDWYWYDDGPFLQRGLERGFMHAPNNERLRFALMWANHNWVNIFPAAMNKTPELLYPGAVTRKTFDQIVEHIIEHYFCHPSYWLIDGCPYFSVYELYRLIEGLGGIDATRDALQHFRNRTVEAGFPDLHLNAVVWGVQILPGEQTIAGSQGSADTTGFQQRNFVCLDPPCRAHILSDSAIHRRSARDRSVLGTCTARFLDPLLSERNDGVGFKPTHESVWTIF